MDRWIRNDDEAAAQELADAVPRPGDRSAPASLTSGRSLGRFCPHFVSVLSAPVTALTKGPPGGWHRRFDGQDPTG